MLGVNSVGWPKNFLNINGRAHSYKNGSWVVVIPDIIVQGNNSIDDLPYELYKMWTQLTSNISCSSISISTSPAAAIAQILAAARKEHSINLGSPFHLNSVLYSSKKKLEVSFFTKLSSWLSSTCSLFGMAFVGFIIFRFCGIGFFITKFIPCCSCSNNCNHFSFFTKTSPDIELGH